MKKRHQQILVFISAVLLFVWNIPVISLYDQSLEFFGFPSVIFFIFTFWMLVIVISFLILKKHHD